MDGVIRSPWVARIIPVVSPPQSALLRTVVEPRIRVSVTGNRGFNQELDELRSVHMPSLPVASRR